MILTSKKGLRWKSYLLHLYIIRLIIVLIGILKTNMVALLMGRTKR
jgi:hypothetical protein